MFQLIILPQRELYVPFALARKTGCSTIDLLITMVTDEIAEETGKDRKETLTDFLCSKTGKALYDEKTKLWCNGPAYIAELYREELKKSGYQI